MTVLLRPWTEDDFSLLRLTNAPAMTEHLGGPERDEKLLARHDRYLRGGMFVIEVAGERAGSIGVWASGHADGVLETGWKVLPAFQGRGVATAAARLVVIEAQKLGPRFLHAFPGRDNPASNAVCRAAGFTLVGPVAIEFPPGSTMLSNDWRVDLHAT